MEDKIKKFKAGEVIISEGTVGKAVYIIRSGKVEVTKITGGKRVQLAVLGPNEIFGEMSMLEERYERRTASVTALEEAKVIMLDRENFDLYLKNTPPGVFTLIKNLSRHLRESNVIIEKLGGAGGKLPESVIAKSEEKPEQKLTYDQMVESMEAAVDLNLIPKKFKRGQVLVREGAEAMSVFLLKSGAVSITKQLGDRQVEIDRLVANEAFGEISMFEDGQRFATAVAVEDGEVVVFSKKDMLEMFRRAPLELYLIMECMGQKLKRLILRYLEQLQHEEKLKAKKEEEARQAEEAIQQLKAQAESQQRELKQTLDQLRKKLAGFQDGPQQTK